MIRTLLLVLFVAFNVSGQAVGPKISTMEKNFDFGKISQGEYVLHDFIITNTGDDVLKIEKVRASCGCTAAKPDKDVLKPGESTKVHVEFNTRGRKGKQRKYIYIYSNDSQMPELRLKLFGEVLVNSSSEKNAVPVLKLEKTQHNFGNIKEGDVVETTIKMKNVGGSDLEIKNVKSSCGCTAAVLSNRILKPNEEGKLRIEFDSSDREGVVTRTVTLFSNDPKNPSQTITIFANIQK